LSHVPVMLEQVVEVLKPAPGQVVVDCTVGGGGHAAAILPRLLPGGRLIGIDQDPRTLQTARERLAPFGEAVTLVHGNFRDLTAILGRVGVDRVHGAFFDLGVSSFQLDEPERGFTYRADAPLDMRMDPGSPLTAADLVNTLPQSGAGSPHPGVRRGTLGGQDRGGHRAGPGAETVFDHRGTGGSD